MIAAFSIQTELEKVQLKIKWCTFALQSKAPMAIQKMRLAKREELRALELELLIATANRLKLVAILVFNEIEFEIINEQIHLL